MHAGEEQEICGLGFLKHIELMRFSIEQQNSQGEVKDSQGEVEDSQS